MIERHLVWSKACDGISTEESWRGARDQQRVTTTGSVGANTVGATIIVQLGSGRGVCAGWTRRFPVLTLRSGRSRFCFDSGNNVFVLFSIGFYVSFLRCLLCDKYVWIRGNFCLSAFLGWPDRNLCIASCIHGICTFSGNYTFCQTFCRF